MIFQEKPEGFSPRFNVVSCFCEHDGRILLLQRQPDDDHGLEWGVPAGKVAEKETPEQAILREIGEETGTLLKPADLSFFTTLYVNHYGYNIIYHIFHTKLPQRPSIRMNPKEHKDFSWVSPSDALGMRLIADLDGCIRMFFNV